MSAPGESNTSRNLPPPYEEAVVGLSTSAAFATPQTTGKFGPFPPSPQSSYNPSYHPQTNNPTLPNPPSMHPEPQTIPVVVGVPVFGTRPCNMICPNCNKTVLTETHTRAGLLAFIICGILLLFGCWAGCCLIPFCVTECLDVDHMCPNCKALLGSYKRI